MAWQAPITWTTNQVVTSAQLNGQIRDNMLETAPAKATTAGAFFAVSGTNSIVQRLPTQALVATSETTTSTSFTDLTTVGPNVTVTLSGSAFIVIYCNFFNSAANFVRMGYEVTGANSIAAIDNHTIAHSTTTSIYNGASFLRVSMASGSSTFTAKYRVSGGTGTFDNRRISVIPF